ncbi:MAG: aminotransferase [Kordiimonadaceae bacterium]|jgi:aspartate/methionine/tyrosine aminotransferase|nr:aminotransferase [Kordiimonadaceae bacterium]MBT6036306.1 aminotransferase [Kordiimonadaceae bacterium]MBT6328327.1 aminotransferase [Kordiimonadaceae bacterium]
MKIREFAIEIWMNEFENNCKLNLSETCVASLTIEQLLEITGKKETILSELLPMKMTYGAIEGSDRLRKSIASLYENQDPENIIVTHGAIGANALIHETFVSPGDEVISILPTYQQHYSIPESYGADVKILNLREENDFLPNLNDLKIMVSAKTKLIVLNNPNNPTGSLMDEEMLLEIVDIARTCDAYLLCDEVYRGTDQEGDGFTASIADIYEKGISTGSMSKTFSLAGLRLGWIAASKEVLEAVSIHRDYNTISVSMLDDHFAAIALENKDKILERSQKITRENLKILDDWIAGEPLISYIKPKSGTIALLKYDLDMSSREFCIKLLEETGVMLTPGSAMDMEGYLRIGFANETHVLKAGLEIVSTFLENLRKSNN